MHGRVRSFRVPKNVGFYKAKPLFSQTFKKSAQKVGPGNSISYRLMRLKKDFLKIHFSNYACSVARTHPSDMPAKTLEKSVQTYKQTHRESNFLPQTTRVLRTIIIGHTRYRLRYWQTFDPFGSGKVTKAKFCPSTAKSQGS